MIIDCHDHHAAAAPFDTRSAENNIMDADAQAEVRSL